MVRSQRVLVVSTVLFLFILVFGFIGFSSIFRFAVRYATSLRRGNIIRNYYIKLPLTLDFKVYFFNVTNPTQVSNGELPKVEEIGPYWYDAYKEKIDIIENDAEDSLTYTPYETYFFNQEKSGNLTQGDFVTIPHPLIVGMVNYVLETDRAPLMPIVAKAIDLLANNPQSIYLTVKVRDILFDGITANCTMKDYPAKAICPQLRMLMHDLITKDYKDIITFSFLGSRNGTIPKRFKVLRGIKKSKDLGRLIEYNYQKQLTLWSSKDCNEFRGTDGWIFPPFLTPEEGIWTFSHDLCRNVQAYYVEDTEFRNIAARKYYATLGNEKCYCPSQQSCPPRGVMNLRPCMGVPIYATMPHMLEVPTSVTKKIQGLYPNMEKHAIRIIFEYMTGTPLEAAKRLQFNIPLHRQNKPAIMKRLPEVLHPIAWIEEAVELSGTPFSLIYTVILFLKYFNIFRYCFLGCTIIGMLTGAVLRFREKNRTTVTPEHDVKQSHKEEDEVLYSRQTTAKAQQFGQNSNRHDLVVEPMEEDDRWKF